ncbi:hypothetical protein SELMODRAFT_412667 [Selaginella moellendorffii]|uniref:DNA/RNA-binding domain-containing protein n=1 Tax=Selaginella moellendorffii TaxID=88036 RepID=D8RM87_SELML|nr:hypothetical protein SELMODRAFT_412667 [Selaginella moellendorffii]
MDWQKGDRLRTQETTPEEQRSRHSKHRRIDSSQPGREGSQSQAREQRRGSQRGPRAPGRWLRPPSLSPEIKKALWKAHHAKITQKSDRVGKKTLKNVVAPLIDFIASSSNFYSELVFRVRVRHGLGGIVSDSCDKSLDESEAREFRETCHRLLLRLGLGSLQGGVWSEPWQEELFHRGGLLRASLEALSLRSWRPMWEIEFVLYHYLKSLFVKIPSPTSHSNLLLLLESKLDAIAEASQGSSNFDNLLRLFEILLLKTGFVTILACSIEDFHLGLVCKTSPPRSWLHETLACAFKVVRTLAAISDTTMLPALVIFTAWLAGSEDTVRATAESDELRRSFLDVLERVQALSVFSEESLSRLSVSQEEHSTGSKATL